MELRRPSGLSQIIIRGYCMQKENSLIILSVQITDREMSLPNLHSFAALEVLLAR